MMRPLLMQRLFAALLVLSPLSVAAEPFAYATGFDALYRVDLATGQANRLGPIGYNDVEGLALSPQGALYGVADATVGNGSGTTDFLLRIDPVTGAGTLVGQLSGLAGQGPAGNLDYGLAFTCDGRLWLSSDTVGDLWELDPAHAVPRRVGNTGQALSGLAAIGNELYGVSIGGAPALYQINPANAVATHRGALNTGAVVDDAGLDFDANGRLWALLDPEPAAVGATRVAQIDRNTGAATVGPPSTVNVGFEGMASAPPSCGVTGIAAPAVQVPGPGPLGLGLLGLLAAMFGGWTLRRAGRS
jgi:streptogramin lyase